MLYPGRVGYTAHQAGHTRQERAWRSHRKPRLPGLTPEEGISFSEKRKEQPGVLMERGDGRGGADHWGESTFLQVALSPLRH